MKKVTTKEELKEAIESKKSKIIVEGKLAKDLRGTLVFSNLSNRLKDSVLKAIDQKGVSPTGFAKLAPTINALTGIEIATIIIALTIGIGLILAICKDYEEIEYQADPPKLKLRRKS